MNGKKIKIIQINSIYGGANSTGRSTMEMHRYLKSIGCNSYVFVSCIGNKKEIDENIMIYSLKIEQYIHSFMSRITGLQGYFSLISTLKLVRKLKEISPDIVILRVLHGNNINFPLLMRYLNTNEIKTILVLHDCWYYTGHCCYYSYVGCERWKKQCGGCPTLRDWNKSWLLDSSTKCILDKKKWFSHKNISVVGVSDWIVNEAKKSILNDAFIIQKIYNWIDMSDFYPRNPELLRKSKGLADGKKIVLGVSAFWNDLKGLREFEELAKQYPSIYVVLIGCMPREYRKFENLICVGTVKESQKLAEFYSMADVFVNPSVMESFGKTTAEAFCCGTPVVAYRTTACAELVDDSRGYCVDLGDVKGLFSAILEVCNKGKQIYKKSCLKFAKDNFDINKNIESYLKLFNILSKNISDNQK